MEVKISTSVGGLAAAKDNGLGIVAIGYFGAMSTLTIANATLAEWQAARTAVSFGTSYSIGGRTLTRADLPDIAIEISRASRLVKRFTTAANGSKMPGVSLPKFS